MNSFRKFVLAWLEETERSQAYLARKADIRPETMSRILKDQEASDRTKRKIVEAIKGEYETRYVLKEEHDSKELIMSQ